MTELGFISDVTQLILFTFWVYAGYKTYKKNSKKRRKKKKKEKSANNDSNQCKTDSQASDF